MKLMKHLKRKQASIAMRYMMTSPHNDNTEQQSFASSCACLDLRNVLRAKYLNEAARSDKRETLKTNPEYKPILTSSSVTSSLKVERA